MSSPEMNQPSQIDQPPSGPGKPKSSGLLIVGLVFIGLALISFIVGYMGKSKAVSAANEFKEGEGDNVKQVLTIPGKTTMNLPAQKYIVWIRLKDISKYKNEEGGFDFSKFEAPPIKWTITGEENVTVGRVAGTFHVNNEVAVAQFTITKPGEYIVDSEVTEGEITETLTVYNDKLDKVGKAGAGMLGGGLAMIAGFGCSGVFGLIGFIITLIYFIK